MQTLANITVTLSGTEIASWFCFSQVTIPDSFEVGKFFGYYLCAFHSKKDALLIQKCQKLQAISTSQCQNSRNLNQLFLVVFLS